MEENKLVRDANGYFSLSLLAECAGGKLIALGLGLCGNERIGDIVIDSRRVTQCSLFVALAGTREDGERYVSEAFMRGATAVLCRRGGAERIGASGVYIEVDDPFSAIVELARRARAESDLFVVGITGSVGKTTVKELCIKVLSQRYPTDGTKGNYNNLLGLSLSILNAFGVEKKIEQRGKSLENGKKRLVLEMGISHRGEMDRLVELAAPDVAIITNVGKMHAEHLGGREGCAKEKARIASLGAARVICPFDGTVLNEVLRYVREDSVTALSFFDKSDCLGGVSRAVINKETDGGEFSVIVTDSVGQNRKYGGFTASIMGEHGVWDSAIAVILGGILGMDDGEIADGLKGYVPEAMRQEIRADGGIVRIVDCYNSGPESVRAALSALSQYARKNGRSRRVAVLGDMLELGEISEGEHFALGAALSDYGVDLLFTVGMQAGTIAEGALFGGLSKNQVVSFGADVPLETVRKEIGSRLCEGDAVLYKASRGIGLERLLPRGTAENEP